MGEMKRANNAVAEVMSDLSSVVNGCPREDLMETSVADMTPVSSIPHQHLPVVYYKKAALTPEQ
jgi:hypothetical protein